MKAALLGLNLVARDMQLQASIRRHLARLQATPKGSRARSKSGGIEPLEERRRKLLELYYAGRIGAELFAEEEDRLSRRIGAMRSQHEEAQAESARASEVAERFEEVARLLADMDVEAIWAEASDEERRVLVEELVEAITIFPDHLEVTVSGIPRLNVALDEVGLTGGWQFCGVGGPTGRNCHPDWRLQPWGAGRDTIRTPSTLLRQLLAVLVGRRTATVSVR